MGGYLATDNSKIYSIRQKGGTIGIGNTSRLGTDKNRLMHMVSDLYSMM